MLTNAKKLKGFHLLAKDGEIGHVEDFFFDDQSWTVRYLVADTGNWLSGRLVLISPFAIAGVNCGEKLVSVNLTKKQIEDSPSIESDMPVSRHYELTYSKYYGWPLYWTGPELWGANPFPAYTGAFDYTRAEEEPREHHIDPHLRSLVNVIGYYIHARDRDIGHVHDFIVDNESWAIRYLIVDTRNWWPGKKVLLAPQWIEDISWHESHISVDLLADAIRNAPEFDESGGITRDYEKRLYEHYNRETYWKNDYIAEPAARRD